MTMELGRRGMWRSRWAAIGAALAVSLGAGGLFVARADSPPSSLVAITPVRVLDTRLAGFGGSLTSGQPRTLTVTGSISTVAADGSTITTAQAVPAGATAIVANVTAVSPTTPGFVAVRPGTASGTPTTSSINATAAGVIVPNSVTVEVPTAGPNAGQIQLFFAGTTASATTDLLVDIVGYSTAISAPAVPEPARVVWVAESGGDFTTVNAALGSITDASAATPYIVKMAPGVYDEPGGVLMKSYVDIEGSGTGTTTIRCACSAASEGAAGGSTVRFTGPVVSELRQISVVNNGVGAFVAGVQFEGTGELARMVDSSVSVGGGTNTTAGIYVSNSTATIQRNVVTVSGTAGFNEGVYVLGNGAPTLDSLDVTATGSALSRAFTIAGSSTVLLTNSVGTATATTSSASVVAFHAGGNARIENSRLIATGGAIPRGVWVFGPIVEIDDSVVSSTGGASASYGVDMNFAGAQVFISDSTITGATFTVRRSDTVNQVARIATSRLSGPTSGTPTCFAVYSATTFAAQACP